MTEQFTLVIICGLVALLYGVVASKSIISADAGNEKMREIASAIQEGAAAYLNRQYITISVVGIVVTIILAITLGFAVAIGFVICLLYTSPSPRDRQKSRMPSSA